MSDLARDRFMNALRILHSIDRGELEDALGYCLDILAWRDFRGNPSRFLMIADDAKVDAIWGIIERRQPKVKP